MDIFNNRQRTGYEEIISYGPRWWVEYKEMDANYQFAGWTLDLMAYWLERTIGNQFPMHADEETIRILENLLGIEYDANATLEERRTMVSIYCAGTGKLSKSVIQSIIKSYTGCDSDIFWDGRVFRVYVLGENGPWLLNDKMLTFIRRRMPSHIAYSLSVEENTQQIEYFGLTHIMVPVITLF